MVSVVVVQRRFGRIRAVMYVAVFVGVGDFRRHKDDADRQEARAALRPAGTDREQEVSEVD